MNETKTKKLDKALEETIFTARNIEISRSELSELLVLINSKTGLKLQKLTINAKKAAISLKKVRRELISLKKKRPLLFIIMRIEDEIVEAFETIWIGKV